MEREEEVVVVELSACFLTTPRRGCSAKYGRLALDCG